MTEIFSARFEKFWTQFFPASLTQTTQSARRKIIFPIVRSNIFAIFRIQKFRWIKNPVPCSMWRYGIFLLLQSRKQTKLSEKSEYVKWWFWYFCEKSFSRFSKNSFAKILAPNNFVRAQKFQNLFNLQLLWFRSGKFHLKSRHIFPLYQCVRMQKAKFE